VYLTIEIGGRNVGGEETTRVAFPRFTASFGGGVNYCTVTHIVIWRRNFVF